MDRKTEEHRNIPAPQPTGCSRATAGRHAGLTVLAASGATKGVALVLHGGKAHSYEPVEARHLSPLRMIPFARHLHRAGKDYGLAVWSLRNSVRGWNGQDMSALHDARWALATDQRKSTPAFRCIWWATPWAASPPSARPIIRRLKPWWRSPRGWSGDAGRPGCRAEGPDRPRHRRPDDQPQAIPAVCPPRRRCSGVHAVRFAQRCRALHGPAGPALALPGHGVCDEGLRGAHRRQPTRRPARWTNCCRRPPRR